MVSLLYLVKWRKNQLRFKLKFLRVTASPRGKKHKRRIDGNLKNKMGLDAPGKGNPDPGNAKELNKKLEADQLSRENNEPMDTSAESELPTANWASIVRGEVKKIAREEVEDFDNSFTVPPWLDAVKASIKDEKDHLLRVGYNNRIAEMATIKEASERKTNILKFKVTDCEEIIEIPPTKSTTRIISANDKILAGQTIMAKIIIENNQQENLITNHTDQVGDHVYLKLNKKVNPLEDFPQYFPPSSIAPNGFVVEIMNHQEFKRGNGNILTNVLLKDVANKMEESDIKRWLSNFGEIKEYENIPDKSDNKLEKLAENKFKDDERDQELKRVMEKNITMAAKIGKDVKLTTATENSSGK